MKTKAFSESLLSHFFTTRELTEALCQPLAVEDYVIQCMEDVSPAKWHLAHTSWFFETFVLLPFLKNYRLFDSLYPKLFNSYYQSLGEPFPRPQRGFLSRPTVKSIMQYRHYVSEHIGKLFKHDLSQDIINLIKLGIHHEQQHQELLLMDIKYNFSINPSYPIYLGNLSERIRSCAKENSYLLHEGGIVEIGNANDEFCFDNELPLHQQILQPFRINTHLVSNQDYLEFIEDGGYQNPLLWLSDGWDRVIKHHWSAPLYWKKIENQWHVFSLTGLKKLNLSEPVCHVSYYEADAFARWSNKRLPTEAEWETLAKQIKENISEGNFLDSHFYHPIACQHSHANFHQFFGDVWEWTQSSYSAYPGFKQSTQALGEYNGKFMSNQMVLRGGCCVTPRSHIRSTYRNFFHPEKRWPFCGFRLAEDAA